MREGKRKESGGGVGWGKEKGGEAIRENKRNPGERVFVFRAQAERYLGGREGIKQKRERLFGFGFAGGGGMEGGRGRGRGRGRRRGRGRGRGTRGREAGRQAG